MSHEQNAVITLGEITTSFAYMAQSELKWPMFT